MGSEAILDDIQPHNIVIGQPVSEAKRILSQQLRREMTETERMLWMRLRRNGVGPQFRRQQNIYGFIADFYCHSAALAVEVDSPSHDPEYDQERDRIFAAQGIRVLRFTNHDVRNRIGWVLAQIKADIARSRADDQ